MSLRQSICFFASGLCAGCAICVAIAEPLIRLVLSLRGACA